MQLVVGVFQLHGPGHHLSGRLGVPLGRFWAVLGMKDTPVLGMKDFKANDQGRISARTCFGP